MATNATITPDEDNELIRYWTVEICVLHVHVYITYTCTHMYMYICTYTCIYTHVHVHMYIYMYTHIHVTICTVVRENFKKIKVFDQGNNTQHTYM